MESCDALQGYQGAARPLRRRVVAQGRAVLRQASRASAQHHEAGGEPPLSFARWIFTVRPGQLFTENEKLTEENTTLKRNAEAGPQRLPALAEDSGWDAGTGDVMMDDDENPFAPARNATSGTNVAASDDGPQAGPSGLSRQRSLLPLSRAPTCVLSSVRTALW